MTNIHLIQQENVYNVDEFMVKTQNLKHYKSKLSENLKHLSNKKGDIFKKSIDKC